jgi:hypothetical protein
MSDLSYTPTREAALSAMRKAQDAYATARQAMERMSGLEAEIAELKARLSVLEEKPKPRRVAA